MHNPGVAASKTDRALTRSGGVGCPPYGPGPNHAGVPGAGKPLGGAAGPPELGGGKGCSASGRRASEGGPHGPPVGAAGIGDDGKGPSGTAGAAAGRGVRWRRRAGWPAPVHRAPGRVRGHRTGDDREGLLRVPMFSGRRDQCGQGGYRDRRLVERGSVLGGQGRHLLNRLGDRQRGGGRLGELRGTLDRRVLRSVLPGCHAVIVDAARAAALRIEHGRGRAWEMCLGDRGRSGYA